MADVQTVVEDDPATDRRYTLVVAVANPAHVEQLMRTAVDIARGNDGEIRVVSVVHTSSSSPFLLLSDERIKQEFAGDRRELLDRAVAAAEGSSVPVRRSLLVGTDVADAILSAVDDVDADALLIGWQGRSRPGDVALGTTVDPVIRRAPCDVFVERVGTTADGMEAVLLATDGGPHVAPAADLVRAVATANDATATVVSYVAPDADEAERATAAEHVEAATERLAGVPVEGGVHEAADVTDAIVASADDHDLVALGATRRGGYRGRVVGSVAESVGRRTASPIVIAKRGGDGSLLSRVLGRWWA